MTLFATEMLEDNKLPQKKQTNKQTKEFLLKVSILQTF